MDILWTICQFARDYFIQYFEDFQQGIGYFFNFKNVLAVFAGVTIGTFCGAIPGFSTTMAVALTLPFIFKMDPLTALTMLSAVYVGGTYGGSISAILINVPGTAAASSTCLDGFKLAQKGKAGKALHMANWASCVGDLVSTIIVIMICPLLGNLAVYIGSPEYFALILFSITIIASVAGKSLIKGLISGAIGFLMTTVGMDPFLGSGRFTFDSLQLMKGFSYVPLLIGLFAIPEVLLQLNRSRQMKGQARVSTVESSDPSDSRMTWADFKGSFRHMVRGGFIGLILGIIPGLGATPSAFTSYQQAKRKSKHPEEFGNGSLEGLAAAESGNNAVNGATLVPLLTLGIPGDVVTAVMLGAFMIFGLSPGPLLFQEHIDLIFGLFCALIMCDLALRLVGIGFIHYAQKVTTKIPTSMLFPSVLVLCVFGSYSLNNSLFDVFIMFTFGLVGYAMALVEMPTIPFLIAFVLAPMLEKGMRRSLTLSGGDFLIFFRSPIAIFFFILTILVVISVARGGMLRKMS
jgi:putative tricarboxylic transport membrane protein